MLRLKEGECVRIVDRAPTAADVRSGLFYSHFRNLRGLVFKLYGTGEQQIAAVDISVDSLPTEVARRHGEVTTQMQSSLTGAARQSHEPFRLRYVVLVSVTDLCRVPIPRSNPALSTPV